MSRRAELIAYALSDSLLERQVIRLLCFAIGIISILASVQLFVTYWLTDYETWIQQTISINAIAYTIMAMPLTFGSILLLSKIFRWQPVILGSLFVIWVYNLSMALLNGVTFAFQATPIMYHLTIGVVSAILYGYYTQRDDHVQDKDVL